MYYMLLCYGISSRSISLRFYILLNPTLSKHAEQQLHDFSRITKHRKATIRRAKVLTSQQKSRRKEASNQKVCTLSYLLIPCAISSKISSKDALVKVTMRRRCIITLPPTPNWSPYIFTLVQKVKIGHKNSTSVNKTKALSRLCKLFHSKKDLYFLHRRR